MLELSQRLRSDGFDSRLDQYVNGAPAEGWPRWMLNQLDAAQHVLVVCTENYYRRFRGHEPRGVGRGADWEGNLITQELYDEKSTSTRFVPIVVRELDAEFIPEPLRSTTFYCLERASDYGSLCAFLHGDAGIEPNPIGERRPSASKAPHGTALRSRPALIASSAVLFAIAAIGPMLLSSVPAVSSDSKGRSDQPVSTSAAEVEANPKEPLAPDHPVVQDSEPAKAPAVDATQDAPIAEQRVKPKPRRPTPQPSTPAAADAPRPTGANEPDSSVPLSAKPAPAGDVLDIIRLNPHALPERP